MQDSGEVFVFRSENGGVQGFSTSSGVVRGGAMTNDAMATNAQQGGALMSTTESDVSASRSDLRTVSGGSRVSRGSGGSGSSELPPGRGAGRGMVPRRASSEESRLIPGRRRGRGRVCCGVRLSQCMLRVAKYVLLMTIVLAFVAVLVVLDHAPAGIGPNTSPGMRLRHFLSNRCSTLYPPDPARRALRHSSGGGGRRSGSGSGSGRRSGSGSGSGNHFSPMSSMQLGGPGGGGGGPPGPEPGPAQGNHLSPMSSTQPDSTAMALLGQTCTTFTRQYCPTIPSPPSGGGTSKPNLQCLLRLRFDEGNKNTPPFPYPPNPKSVPPMFQKILDSQSQTGAPLCICAVVADSRWFLDFAGEAKESPGVGGGKTTVFIIVCVGLGVSLLVLLVSILYDLGACRGPQSMYASWQGRGGRPVANSWIADGSLIDHDANQGRELSDSGQWGLRDDLDGMQGERGERGDSVPVARIVVNSEEKVGTSDSARSIGSNGSAGSGGGTVSADGNLYTTAEKAQLPLAQPLE